ncbi:MAG: hypothetical protein ACI4QB_06395, partial [Eubacteriales bacterium]
GEQAERKSTARESIKITALFMVVSSFFRLPRLPPYFSNVPFVVSIYYFTCIIWEIWLSVNLLSDFSL